MRFQSEKKGLTQFGDLFLPREAIEPILSASVRGALLEWLTEIFAEAELKALGIGPRKRAIFDGPPGVGKTTLAHHLAARLGLPMLAVRPERIIDSWVGSTGQNIGALFDIVRDGFSLEGNNENKVPVVLFLDEFDALGHKRRSSTRQGAEDERNSFINTLLQRIEQHEGFLIAATNFGKDIDPAIWRRFDMHIGLDLPGQFERERILARYLLPFGMPQSALQLFAEGFDSASPALMRAFCEHLKRQIVIGPKLGMEMAKEAVFSRLVASVQPHPDLGKPPFWATAEHDRARDRAIVALPWPLPLAADLAAEGTGGGMAELPASNVVPIGRASSI